MKKNPNWGGTRTGAGARVSVLRLSVPESLLIADALNCVTIDPSLAEQLIWKEVEEAVQYNHLDQKWNVDGAALVSTLRKLSHKAALKLVEDVNRFWQSQAH